MVAIAVIVVLLLQQEADIFLRAGILVAGVVLYFVNYFTKRGLDRRAPGAR